MKYLNIYNNLINRARNRILETYTEKHHIVPKCFGGTNNKINIVHLTAREHYLAHQLLVKIYPDEYALVFAANMMTKGPKGRRLNNREYGWLKEKRSNAMRKRWEDPEYRAHMTSKAHGKKISDAMAKSDYDWSSRDRTYMQTKEYKKKVSDGSKKQWADPEFRVRHKEALRESRIARGMKS